MKSFLCLLAIFATATACANSSVSSDDLWVIRSPTGNWNNPELCLPIAHMQARYFTDRPIRQTNLVSGKALAEKWHHDAIPNIVLFAHYGKITIQDDNIAIIKQRSDAQQWCLTLDQFQGKSTLPIKASLSKVTLLIGD